MITKMSPIQMAEKLSIGGLVTGPKPNHRPNTGHLKYAHTCRIQMRSSLART